SKHIQKELDQIKQRLNQVHKVTILGDSVAKGYGSDNDGITSYLKQYFNYHYRNVDVVNRGIVHLTSDQLLEDLKSGRYDQDIRSSNILLINIGGNDLLNYFFKGGPSAIVKNFFKIKKNYAQNIDEIID